MRRLLQKSNWLMIVAITAVVFTGLMVAAAMQDAHHDTGMMVAVIGFAGLFVNGVFGMIRAEQSRANTRNKMESIDQKLEDLHTKAGPNHVQELQVVAENVRRAEHDQLLNETSLPKTGDELRGVMLEAARIAVASCHEQNVQVVKEAIHQYHSQFHNQNPNDQGR